MTFRFGPAAVAAVVAVLCTATTTLRAQTPITPGNLVVVRVGDGTTTISASAAAVSLLEIHRTTGAVVQTINLPSSGASALTLRGTSTTEGILSVSGDGNLITFGGYRADAGAANPSGTGAAGQVPRAIGVLNLTTGTFNTSQAIGTGGDQSYWNDSFRSVVTDNGARFWTSGAASAATGGGVRFVADSATTSSTSLSASSANSRQLQILEGSLFVSAGSNVPGRSVFQVGTGLPTSGTPTFTNSIPVAASDQYNSFYFTRLGTGTTWNGTTFDTVYVADTNGNRLAKFSFDGATWLANGTITVPGTGLAFTGTAPANIAGETSGSTVHLLGATTNAGTGGLYDLTDASGFNGSITTATFANVGGGIVVGANFAFRGVAFAPSPVPEPGAILALVAGVLGVGGYVRRRARAPQPVAV